MIRSAVSFLYGEMKHVEVHSCPSKPTPRDVRPHRLKFLHLPRLTPHFWALSLNLAEEYARAGVPMLPVVAGRADTKRQILLYSVLLVRISLIPWALGFAGAISKIQFNGVGGLRTYGSFTHSAFS